jgi:hypothetical protein
VTAAGPERVFRTPPAVRIALAVSAAVCALGLVWQARAFLRRPDARRVVAAAIMGVPCGLAAAAWRRRVEVFDDGLRSVSLTAALRVPWADVLAVEQGRSSYVIETRAGPVSAGWLAPRDRDGLLRIVLERAGLLARPGKLRWGLRARYLPRKDTR